MAEVVNTAAACGAASNWAAAVCIIGVAWAIAWACK